MNIKKCLKTLQPLHRKETTCKVTLSHSRKKLNSARALYFLCYSSFSCFCPFESMYLATAGGLDSNILGMLQAITPIVTSFVTPLWGRAADSTENKKHRVLAVAFSMSVLTRLLIPFSLHSFWLLALVKTTMSIFYAPVRSLIDSTIITSLEEDDVSQFGRLRLWGQFGNGVSSTLMIFAMQKFNSGVIFLTSGILSIPAFLCIVAFNSGRPRSAEQDEKVQKRQSLCSSSQEDIFLLLKDGRVLGLFSLAIIYGCGIGFLETFVYVHIPDFYAKATNHGDTLGRDMTLCRIFMSAGGMMMFWCIGWLSKQLGQRCILLSSLFIQSFCFHLYSIIDGVQVDWFIRCSMMLAEAMRGATFAAFWSTATVYAHGISPPTAKSTVLLLMETAYKGFGQTAGAMLGGRLVSKLGSIPIAFSCASCMIFSVATVTTSVVAAGEYRNSVFLKKKKQH